MPFLSLTNQGNQTDRFSLIGDAVTIGRHPECDIVVDAGAVSRYHAKIFRRGKDFFVEDSGSRNGTYLNGQLLSSAQMLREGDHIRISDVDLTFHHDEAPQFMQGAEQMTFDGASFGIVMSDDESDTEQLSSGGSSSRVEFRSSHDGLTMSATPEAKLAALMRINMNLTGALSLDKVLPKVLESLFDIFPAADRGFIVMKQEDESLIPTWVKARKQVDLTETFKISRTIIKRVMDTREAILSLDAANDERFDSSQSIADFSIRSMMCAPLCDGDGLAYGALQIDSTQGRGQFRDDDIDLLRGVAAQAGIVINNARMHEQALRQKEVEQDLKLATEVQHAFLPQAAPDTSGFRIRSYYQAANHIGGDYFDYIDLPNGRIGVVVADVVGHGVAAAMFMAKLSAETRFCLASEHDIAKAVERLNARMSMLQVERFVSFLLVVIDPSSELVTIVNAGHMAPIVRQSKDGSIVEPGEEESGLPIAVVEDSSYESAQFRFGEGDLAVLYTDGINEAMDLNDQEFGIEQMRRLTAAGGTAEDVRNRVVAAVWKHVGSGVQFDDMCLVVIERISPPQRRVNGDGTL
jgi:serine phosphatase RsbU (regulator of sigma subunit)